jgi:tRNA pseudouridine55 synthase
LLAGLHLVHKPVGATSFQLVQAFMADEAEAAIREGRKPLPLCHGGTLDPFAEGLLLMLVGQTTRLMDLFHAAPKVYVTEIAWGLETDNGDLNGREVSRGDASRLAPEALEAALAPFLGWQDQVPPATSAKKIDGEPAYKKAHRGEEVVLKPSKVFLHRARWLSHHLPGSSTVELTCRGGFYVRSFARDLGRALGCGAHVRSLRRTAIGPWLDPPEGQRVLVHGESLLPWCPSRPLSEADLEDLRHGRPIARGEIKAPDWPVPEGFPDPQGPIRALRDGKLWALLKEDGEKLATFANLRGGL